MLQQQAVDVPVLERGKCQAPRGAWPAPPEELLQLQWESDRIRQQATRPGVRTLGGDVWMVFVVKVAVCRTRKMTCDPSKRTLR